LRHPGWINYRAMPYQHRKRQLERWASEKGLDGPLTLRIRVSHVRFDVLKIELLTALHVVGGAGLETLGLAFGVVVKLSGGRLRLWLLTLLGAIGSGTASQQYGRQDEHIAKHKTPRDQTKVRLAAQIQGSQDYNLYIRPRVDRTRIITPEKRRAEVSSATAPLIRAIVGITKSLYCHFV
jgi:hypothetical protein